MLKKIVIGTRGSDLARAQTQLVIDSLQSHWPGLTTELKAIITAGDESKVVAIDSRAGRKGLFTKAIEGALVAGEIDLAVHSAKDLPSDLEPNTEIAAVLPRAQVEDVFISTFAHDLQSVPQNGLVATGSIRRKCQLRWQRPDLQLIDLRGNVPTRLQKLAREKWSGIVLASAGLERLGFDLTASRIYFDRSEFFIARMRCGTFLPAGGQGTIAIQRRTCDEKAKQLLEKINDRETQICLRAEREFLRLLNCDCNQPVGVLAKISDAELRMQAQIFDEVKIEPRAATVEGDANEPEILAAKLFATIKRA